MREPTAIAQEVDASVFFQPNKTAVDRPSAERLAKRLFDLDGFKRSDVAKHLSKRNDFSQLVADEYVKYFVFKEDSLDEALRGFLASFSLSGETQERERVLMHFSRRYVNCNPTVFNSEDSCHTLTCAIMLLNTDLHGQNIGKKMSCPEFIDNLAGLNDGDNYPKDILKKIYHAIKSAPLEWAVDEFSEKNGDVNGDRDTDPTNPENGFSTNEPDPIQGIEYKKGYVMRKCVVDGQGRKLPLGKRGWRMFCGQIRDMVLFLSKDEEGLDKTTLTDSLNNALLIHHCLATKAIDYTKKQHVFRLQTADWAIYLFQTGDVHELEDWIDTINLVSASLSTPPLSGGVGSQVRFQRPIMPTSHTRLNLREQLSSHEVKVMELEKDLEAHLNDPLSKNAKKLVRLNYAEKEQYLKYETQRYKTYVNLLQTKMAAFPELEPSLVATSIGEVDEQGNSLPNPAIQTKISPQKRHHGLHHGQGKVFTGVSEKPGDRQSYKAAIYNKYDIGIV